MRNRKRTTVQSASQAGETLSNDSSSMTARKLAASALAQRKKGARSGKKTALLASAVLKSSKYSKATKALAGIVASHSPDK